MLAYNKMRITIGASHYVLCFFFSAQNVEERSLGRGEEAHRRLHQGLLTVIILEGSTTCSHETYRRKSETPILRKGGTVEVRRRRYDLRHRSLTIGSCSPLSPGLSEIGRHEDRPQDTVLTFADIRVSPLFALRVCICRLVEIWDDKYE